MTQLQLLDSVVSYDNRYDRTRVMASWLDELRALDGVLLSIVVPAFRSAAVLERHLPVLFAYLESLKITYEVVVCDDGSDDGGATRRISERLGCVYVANEQNRGKG